MSRIGRKPINIPAGVTISIDNGVVTVKGPKGTLTQTVHKNMEVKIEADCVQVNRPNDQKENRALHGLTRTLISNMVIGVTEGVKKALDVHGVGYRVQKQGKELHLTLGFSHPVSVSEPDEISIECPSANKIIISGIDKQKVGQFAANIRAKRPPEPYKGKGIRYVGEYVRQKEGKAGKGAKK